LNVRVRLEVPAHLTGRENSAELRIVSGGTPAAKVETSMRSWADGRLTYVELTPKSPLTAKTRYAVALTDPKAYPSTVVLSSFTTGDAADTTAPKIDAFGSASAQGNIHAMGADCSIPGPWITISGLKSSDPGRSNAKLVYGIWLADSAAALDTSKPPTTLIEPYDDHVTVGRRSLCDPRDMKLPTTQFAYLAIAAVDEAGNTSAIRKLPKIDLKGVGSHP
jgi:hypothetical protein